MCGHENETLKHFILDCEMYKDVRIRYMLLQRPYIESENELIADVLGFQECSESEIETRKTLILEF